MAETEQQPMYLGNPGSEKKDVFPRNMVIAVVLVAIVFGIAFIGWVGGVSAIGAYLAIIIGLGVFCWAFLWITNKLK